MAAKYETEFWNEGENSGMTPPPFIILQPFIKSFGSKEMIGCERMRTPRICFKPAHF